MKSPHFALLAAAAALSTAAASAELDVRPDTLLAVDTHRESIVERTIAAWPGGVSGEQAEMLRRTLWGLRADRLLAASLTPGMPGLVDVLAAADRNEDAVASQRVSTKVLGDIGADLTYTPSTPCRIVDTRNAGGVLAPNNMRTFRGFDAASFADQGGSATNCGIPAGVAALVMNVYAVNPTNLGFIKLWPSGTPEPAVSTVNYQPPTVAIATGTILPVTPGSANGFHAKSPAQVHMVVDVVGYFRSPTSGYVKQMSVGPGMTVNGQTSVNGTTNVNLQLLPTQVLPTTPCTNNQIPKWNGAAWTCAADATGGGGGTGTVTSVATGAGLTGGPITTSGTIGLATTQLLPTTACASNQIPKWNGSAWTCAADASGSANAFIQGGNAFGAPGGVIGTTDFAQLDVMIGGQRVVRYVGLFGTPASNIIAGHPQNSVNVSATAVTIAGGGRGESTCYDPATNLFTRSCANSVGTPGSFAVIGGGESNQANGLQSTVSGGVSNTTSNQASTVAGGASNRATGNYSTVGGGARNNASGHNSSIPGGDFNVAAGTSSFAAGHRAKANAAGCFVWADGTDMDIPCDTANAWVARASGGVTFFTYQDPTNIFTGVTVPAGGGSWSSVSDRAAKENFVAVDTTEVLERLLRVPVSEWNYKSQDASIRHVGPVAQDFRAAFDVGENERMISTVDAQGIAFAAIQGLNAKLEAKLEERDAEIRALRAEISELRATREDVAALRAAVGVLLRERAANVQHAAFPASR